MYAVMGFFAFIIIFYEAERKREIERKHKERIQSNKSKKERPSVIA